MLKEGSKLGGKAKNRYKLLNPIGKGSFSCVWNAKDRKTKELVAIKFVNH